MTFYILDPGETQMIYSCEKNVCEKCKRDFSALPLATFNLVQVLRSNHTSNIRVHCNCIAVSDTVLPLVREKRVTITLNSSCTTLSLPPKHECKGCTKRKDKHLSARIHKGDDKSMMCEKPWNDSNRTSSKKTKRNLYQMVMQALLEDEHTSSRSVKRIRKPPTIPAGASKNHSRMCPSTTKKRPHKRPCSISTPANMKGNHSGQSTAALGSFERNLVSRFQNCDDAGDGDGNDDGDGDGNRDSDGDSSAICPNLVCMCAKHHLTARDMEQLFKTNGESLGWKKLKNGEEVIRSSVVSGYKNQASALRKMKSTITGVQRFKSQHQLQRSLIGISAITTPKCSQESMELISSMQRAATLLELGFSLCSEDAGEKKLSVNVERERGQPTYLDVGSIAKSNVKYKTIGNLIQEEAAHSLLIEREEIINSAATYCNTDKGQEGHLVKILSRWDDHGKKVRTFLLDIEKSTGHSNLSADAIKHSTGRLYLLNRFRFAGGCTDAGGGGTGYSLKRSMVAINIADENSLVSFCGLHGIQLILKIPCDAIVGVGSVGNRNTVQFLHSLYDLQRSLGIMLWREYCKEASAKLGIPLRDWQGRVVKEAIEIQEPILTRWWTLGLAASYYTWNDKVLAEVVIVVIEGRGGAKGVVEKSVTIAIGTFSLQYEGVVVADCFLIKGFTNYFINPHMKWMQRGDKQTGGTPGFLARLMLSRYFIMDEDLKGLCKGGWKSKAEFDGFAKQLENVSDTHIETLIDKDGALYLTCESGKKTLRDVQFRPLTSEQRDLQVKKAEEMFIRASEKLHSVEHYKPYLDQSTLLFLGLFGEAPTARIVAKIFLGENIIDLPEGERIFKCPQNNRDIDLNKFAQFIQQRPFEWDEFETDIFDYGEDEVPSYIQHHILHTIKLENIHMIASDNTDIWDTNPDEVTNALISDLMTDLRGELTERRRVEVTDELKRTKAQAKKFAEDKEAITKIYKRNYAALPSTTHMVEAGVKIAGISDNGQRTALRASQYAIGSNLTRDKNDLGKELMLKDKVAKGEQYKDDDGIRARGECSIKALTHLAIHRHAAVKNIKRNDPSATGILEKMKDSLKVKEEGFANELLEKQKLKNLDQREKNKDKSAPKFALAIGTEITSAMQGHIPFSNLKKDKHWDFVVNEVEARDNQVECLATYQATVKMLRNLCKSESKTFEPLTMTAENFRKIEARTQVRENVLKAAVKAEKKKKKSLEAQQSARNAQSRAAAEAQMNVNQANANKNN